MKRYDICVIGTLEYNQVELIENPKGEIVKYESWMDDKEALYQRLIKLEQQRVG